MSARLLIAPYSTGKTEFVLRSARADAAGLARQPILCVPTPIQAQSARKRLAHMGGAIGVRIVTFDGLYTWLLDRSGVNYTELQDAALFRLMQELLQRLAAEGALRHYYGIANTPGLANLMLDRIGELQGALVDPASLLDFWREVAAPNRLLDIGVLYDAWRQLLVQQSWSDRVGVGVLALDTLLAGKVRLDATATPLYFDGFDFLNELQLQLVVALAHLPGAQATVTLTGDLSQAEAAHPSANRFDATRVRLIHALHVDAEPLPPFESNPATRPVLQSLRRRLATDGFAADPLTDADGALHLLEASQRTTEVRAALRWLKRAIVLDGVPASDCALLVRDITRYRTTIVQVAQEFGVPVVLVRGLPIEENPAINALLALLKLALPTASGEPALPRDEVVALFRSPYFDLAPLGAWPHDAERLDAFARAALVVRGVDAWRTAFAAALTTPLQEVAEPADDADDEAERATTNATSAAIERLASIVARLSAGLIPHASATMRQHIAWLEGVCSDAAEADEPALALGFLASIQRGAPAERTRDEAAFLAFKHLLRGLLWSAEQLAAPPITWSEFLHELGGALEGARYDLPVPGDAIFCGATVDARGLPFSHVAILGMVEGELPQRTQDDPFLREEDRQLLRRRFPGVQHATDSQEREYFIEAVARAEDALLLTRPVIGDDGSAAEPSPYWLEMLAVLGDTPSTTALSSERAGALPDSALAASLPELMRSLAQHPHAAAEAWLTFHRPDDLRAIDAASHILDLRAHRQRSAYDGDLRAHLDLLADEQSPTRQWSPTAFETWLTCPLFYFTSRHLHLEERTPPEAEVDRGAIGSIYHEILQELFKPSSATEPAIERLDAVAQGLLDTAPARHGFLATAIWQQQAAEILANLRKTVAALETLGGTPIGVERRYQGESALRVASDSGDFLVRGVVDRIDALPDGTLRIIDYKTGKGDYNSIQGLAQGKRLQLPLYARMVDGEHGEGAVGDGIYFFAHTGEAAKWSLAAYPDGIDAASEVALNWARRAVTGIRAGDFAPTPPSDGCPDYCPATAFCWQYRPGGYR